MPLSLTPFPLLHVLLYKWRLTLILNTKLLTSDKDNICFWEKTSRPLKFTVFEFIRDSPFVPQPFVFDHDINNVHYFSSPATYSEGYPSRSPPTQSIFLPKAQSPSYYQYQSNSSTDSQNPPSTSYRGTSCGRSLTNRWAWKARRRPRNGRQVRRERVK